MISPYVIYMIPVTIISLISLVLIIQTALQLRKSIKATSIAFSELLFGMCVEITLSTVALPLIEYVMIWAILRTIGRLIEIILVIRFLNFLKKG